MEKDKIGRGFKRHCLHMSHGGGRGERIVFSALEGLSFSPFLSSLTFKLFPVCLGFLSSERRKPANLFPAALGPVPCAISNFISSCNFCTYTLCFFGQRPETRHFEHVSWGKIKFFVGWTKSVQPYKTR